MRKHGHLAHTPQLALKRLKRSIPLNSTHWSLLHYLYMSPVNVQQTFASHEALTQLYKEQCKIQKPVQWHKSVNPPHKATQGLVLY